MRNVLWTNYESQVLHLIFFKQIKHAFTMAEMMVSSIKKHHLCFARDICGLHQ